MFWVLLVRRTAVFLLVVLGLIISVPIMVFGSSLVLKWMERFPWIVYVGAGVLALTAASMIDKDPLLEDYFSSHVMLDWALYIVIAGGVLSAGYWRNSNDLRKCCPKGKAGRGSSSMQCQEAMVADLLAYRQSVLPRHSREGGNPASYCKRRWVPAFAGTTNCFPDERKQLIRRLMQTILTRYRARRSSPVQSIFRAESQTNMRQFRIAPSILSANFAKLGEEVTYCDRRRRGHRSLRCDGQSLRAESHHRPVGVRSAAAR